MQQLADKGVSPSVVDDQVGRLTFTEELSRATRHLLDVDAPYGTYNVSNGGDPTSFADVARAVFELSGRSSADVSSVTTEEYFAGKDLAPRPLHSVMDLSKLRGHRLRAGGRADRAGEVRQRRRGETGQGRPDVEQVDERGDRRGHDQDQAERDERQRHAQAEDDAPGRLGELAGRLVGRAGVEQRAAEGEDLHDEQHEEDDQPRLCSRNRRPRTCPKPRGARNSTRPPQGSCGGLVAKRWTSEGHFLAAVFLAGAFLRSSWPAPSWRSPSWWSSTW